MREQGTVHAPDGLAELGLTNARSVWWNLNTPALYEQAVKRDEGLVAHAAAMGDRLQTRLREATADCAAVRDVRGRGLLIGVDLADMSPADVSAVADRTRDEGVLIGTTGPRYDVLKVRPPLVITADQVDAVAAAVAFAIRQIADC